jgi:hypothetical protein
MNVGLLRLQSAPIWKYLQGWWAEEPDFVWAPTGGATGFVDLVTGIPFMPTNGAVVVPGGIVNPANSTTPVMLTAADGIIRGASTWGAMSLVSGITGNQRGMILKIGNGSTGLGLAVGNSDETNVGTKALLLREAIAWHAGSVNAWVDGCNAAWLQATASVGTSAEIWPASVAGPSASATYNAPTGNAYINGRPGSSSPFTVHCVFIFKNRWTTSGEEVAFRLRLVAQVEDILRMPREQIMRMFVPSPFYLPYAAAGNWPNILSAPTYVPGSLTSTGFRPRVTATY